MIKSFNTTVNVKETGNGSVLRGLVQYDTLNEVNIRLSDGFRAFDYTGYTNIIFKVLKADGTTYIDSEGIRVVATSPADGLITVTLAGQATAAAGLCQSLIEIYYGGKKMATARLNYEVVGSLKVDEEQIKSEPEYPALQTLVSDVSALETRIEIAENARQAAENAREAAEAAREDKETGYVAQAASYAEEAASHANDLMNAATKADNAAQQTSKDSALALSYMNGAKDYWGMALESADAAAASAAAIKLDETLMREAKESASTSAKAAVESASEVAKKAAEIDADAEYIKSNISSAAESAETAEYNEMLSERWASTAQGWSEGGKVVTNVRIDDEGRTVFTVSDAYGAKQYAADAAASAESIVQYETDLGAAVQSAQKSATNAKSAEDLAVAAKTAAEKARDEAQAISGGDFANSVFVEHKMEEAVSSANQYTDSEIWDHNYSTSAHGDIRGRIYNVEQTRPFIVSITRNDRGVHEADQYMEDIARAGNNGRVVIAVVSQSGAKGDAGTPIDYDLYYMTDCHIVNRGVAAFTVTEIRFRNANGEGILITSDDMVEFTDEKFDVSDQISVHDTEPSAHSDIRSEIAVAKSYANTQLSNHDKSKDAHADIRAVANEAYEMVYDHIVNTDISGEINGHNESEDAHADIRELVNSKADEDHGHNADAITDGILSVDRGGTGVTSIGALASLLGGTKIATGSYEGANAVADRMLTFPFAPKLIVISGEERIGVCVVPADNKMPCYCVALATGNMPQKTMSVTTDGNVVYLETTPEAGAVYTLNQYGKTYYWVAFG